MRVLLIISFVLFAVMLWIGLEMIYRLGYMAGSLGLEP
jgi:hypothetical protein